MGGEFGQTTVVGEKKKKQSLGKVEIRCWLGVNNDSRIGPDGAGGELKNYQQRQQLLGASRRFPNCKQPLSQIKTSTGFGNSLDCE
jgi:hypothetical protein